MTQASTPKQPTPPAELVPKEFVIERFLLKLLLRAALALLLVAAAAYPLDFALWRTRVALSHDGHGGMGSVLVSRFTVAELKGGKEDIYPEGTALLDCSRTLYPQGGYSACWWLQRHREVFDKY